MPSALHRNSRGQNLMVFSDPRLVHDRKLVVHEFGRIEHNGDVSGFVVADGELNFAFSGC